jgi:uncharacterized protein YebE (UPF0316 family)
MRNRIFREESGHDIELLFIFFARVIDVYPGTIRMILVIRGDKLPAAIIGFFEIMVYTAAMGIVVGPWETRKNWSLLRRVFIGDTGGVYD